MKLVVLRSAPLQPNREFLEQVEHQVNQRNNIVASRQVLVLHGVHATEQQRSFEPTLFVLLVFLAVRFHVLAADSEINQADSHGFVLALLGLSNHDIGRLDISVHKASLMNDLQLTEQLDSNLQYLCASKTLSLNVTVKAVAVLLHDDEKPPRFVFGLFAVFFDDILAKLLDFDLSVSQHFDDIFFNISPGRSKAVILMDASDDGNFSVVGRMKGLKFDDCRLSSVSVCGLKDKSIAAFAEHLTNLKPMQDSLMHGGSIVHHYMRLHLIIIKADPI